MSLYKALKLYTKFLKANAKPPAQLKFGLDDNTLFLAWIFPEEPDYFKPVIQMNNRSISWFAKHGLRIEPVAIPETLWARLPDVVCYYIPGSIEDVE